MTTDTAAGVCRTDAASVAATMRPERCAAHCPDGAAAHPRAAVPLRGGTVSAETRVYLCVKFVNDLHEGMHPDVQTYLDKHLGAHRITGQFEPDHLWIVPLYAEVRAGEIRVPTCAVWVVGE